MTLPPGDLGDFARDLFRGEDHVRRAGGDGVLRHGGIDGRRRFLHKDEPSPLLDSLYPLAAVQPEAGEDDGDGSRPEIGGERGEKTVYGVMRPSRDFARVELTCPL